MMRRKPFQHLRQQRRRKSSNEHGAEIDFDLRAAKETNGMGEEAVPLTVVKNRHGAAVLDGGVAIQWRPAAFQGSEKKITDQSL